jgi:hypothetical protein
MFPPVYEETLTLKEFAAFIGCGYHSARRLLVKYGGYRVIGNGNPNYETRNVTIQRAEEIKNIITKGGLE